MRTCVRRTALLVVGALAAASAGACSDDDAVAPEAAPANAALTPASLQTLGDNPTFIEIAAQVPSFAGFWFNREGTQIVVGVTDPREFQHLAAMIHRRLGAHKPRGSYVAAKVSRSFVELARYRAALRSQVFDLPDVVSLGVKESANRVEVGIANPGAEPAIRGLVRSLGIPNEAVAIVNVSRPHTSSHTLRSAHPNGVLEGGWQIESGAGTCSLGFVALRSDGSPVFVTASHCTTTSPGYDGGTITQGGVVAGSEILDPPVFACPWMGVPECRNADAALISASRPISLGKIARTTARTDADISGGPLTIDHANPTFTITSKYPDTFENEPLDKVGRTTGWSHGNVEDTCTDYNIDGWIRLCSDRVDFATDHGDSGSPVFSVNGNGTVQLRGVVFGWQGWPYNDALISDMRQVELDLGTLTVHTVQAGVNGPSIMEPYADGTWNSVVTGGRGPYTFSWYRDGTLVSTASSYSGNAGSADFELRLTVSDALGGSSTDVYPVTVWTSGCPPPEIIC